MIEILLLAPAALMLIGFLTLRSRLWLLIWCLACLVVPAALVLRHDAPGLGRIVSAGLTLSWTAIWLVALLAGLLLRLLTAGWRRPRGASPD